MSTQFDITNGIIPLSKFRQSSKSYLKKMQEGESALVLTQNGKSAAVVLTPQAYERMEYERELFRAIAEGEKNIEEGKTIPHNALFKKLLA